MKESEPKPPRQKGQSGGDFRKFVSPSDLTESEINKLNEGVTNLVEMFKEDLAAVRKRAEEEGESKKEEYEVIIDELKRSFDTLPEEYHENETMRDIAFTLYSAPRMTTAMLNLGKREFYDQSEISESQKRDYLFTAEWQIKASKTIEVVRELEHPQKDEILSSFWENLETFFEERISNPELAKNIKTGILGLTPVMEIAQECDLQAYYPTNKEDAFEGIDLWIMDPDKLTDGVVNIVQVKTTSLGITTIKSEEVEEVHSEGEVERKGKLCKR